MIHRDGHAGRDDPHRLEDQRALKLIAIRTDKRGLLARVAAVAGRVR